MIAGFEDVRHNVTIHDARNIPDNFHEAGFTLIKLDEVNNKYIDTPDLCKKNKKIMQEPETQDWRYSSEDIHLFHSLLNPYLLDLYPQTKVLSTHTPSVLVSVLF